jgi:hypothetical protein
MKTVQNRFSFLYLTINRLNSYICPHPPAISLSLSYIYILTGTPKTHAKGHSARSFAATRCLNLLAIVLLCAAPAFAANITGTVTNGTTGKPSPGDTIAAVNMAQSMDEIAKATSDTSGIFHIAVPDDGQILLHITHRGAEYFKTLPPGASTIDLQVFDSAAKVSGITAEAMVLRFETDPIGKTLHVSENFFVKNDSAPPRTEVGGNTYDFYMPKGAQVVQSMASTPNGLPTDVKLSPVDTATGHYGFTFPLRPGETLFQIIYTLPYTGSQPFSLKLPMPTGDVAVVLPKSMQFDGGNQFQPIEPDPSTQNFDAHKPASDQPVHFTISGTGTLPQRTQDSQGGAQSAGDQSANTTQSAQQPAARDSRPGGGLGVPDDPDGTNDPWAKYKWWIIGGLGLALAVGAGIMLKSNPSSAPAAPAPQPASDITGPAGTYIDPATVAPTRPAGSSIFLQALKDELFALEADRLSGKLTEAEYTEQKSAFDIVLRRALNRSNPA